MNPETFDRAEFDRHDRAGTLPDLLVALTVERQAAAAAPDGVAGGLVDELRLGLVAATVREQLGRFGPVLLGRLIDAGYRDPAQALAELCAARAAGWQALLALLPRLDGTDRAAAGKAAIAAARAVARRSDRARALYSVGLALPECDRTPVLTEALDVLEGGPADRTHQPPLAEFGPGLPAALHERAAGMARATVDPEHRAKNLLGLASGAIPGLFPELLALIRGHPDEWWGHHLLVRAAPLLPEHLLVEALEVADGIRKPEQRGLALGAVGRRLTGVGRDTAIAAALAAAGQVRAGRERVTVLSAIAAELPAPHFAEAVEFVAAPGWVVPDGVLAGLASHASAAQLATLLDAATGGNRPNARACAELVPFIDAGQRDRALAGVRAGWSPVESARLAPLLAHVRDELVAEAVADAVTDSSPYNLRLVAQQIAPYLSPDQAQALLDAYRRSRAEFPDVAFYRALAPALRPGSVTAVLDGLVDDLAEAYHPLAKRVSIVDALAPSLPPALLAAALATTRRNADERPAAQAMAALLTAAPGAVDAGDLLDRCGGPTPRLAAAWAEAGLAGHLPPSRVVALAAAAGDLPDPGRRIWTLARLAPHLDREERAPVVATVVDGADEVKNSDGLIELVAPFVATERRAAVLDAALDRYGRPRHDGLAGLAGYLDHAQLIREIGLVEDEEYDNDQACALAVLAPHLPADLVPAALAVADRIGATVPRVEAVLALMSRLDPPTAAQRWRVEWDRASGARHSDLAHGLLARRAPAEERTRAHTVADQPPPHGRSGPPRAGLIQMLDEFAALPPDPGHAWQFGDLIRSLPADLLRRAVDIATHPHWQNTDPLAAAATRAHELWCADPGVPLRALLSRVLAGRSRSDHLDLLPALAPVLADLGGPPAVAATAFAVADVLRSWP